MNITAYLTSLARTAVPSAWGILISWAVGAGLLSPELQAQAQSFAFVLVGVVIAAYYGLLRLLEAQPWWPAWLSTLFLGAPTVPVYVGQSSPAATGDATTLR